MVGTGIPVWAFTVKPTGTSKKQRNFFIAAEFYYKIRIEKNTPILHIEYFSCGLFLIFAEC